MTSIPPHSACVIRADWRQAGKTETDVSKDVVRDERRELRDVSVLWT